MIIRRPEMRFKLASLLAKMMNLPAPLQDGDRRLRLSRRATKPDRQPKGAE